MREKNFACFFSDEEVLSQYLNGRFGKEKFLGWCGVSMVGQETNAIAESADRLCVTTRAHDSISEETHAICWYSLYISCTYILT